MLFLSNVDKAQVILLSSGLEEQPESVQFGGSLVKVSCNTTLQFGGLLVKVSCYTTHQIIQILHKTTSQIDKHEASFSKYKEGK